jgi:GntR family transcriptional repressor for pyruvate dehydrogenase complex
MPFQQIKTPKGSDIVSEQIKKRILSGEFPPGARLPTVVELAGSFQLGRSTIREALSALKAMGWIDIRHGGGTFVNNEIPPAEQKESGDPFYLAESFQEIIEVRKYIESGCASLAAKRRTDEDLINLELILREMEETLGDETRSEQADIAFHLRIAAASGNSLFVHMMQSLTQKLQEHIKGSRQLWFFAERASAEQLLREHRAICEAIRSGDAQLAFERMVRHIEKVDDVLQKLLKEQT